MKIYSMTATFGKLENETLTLRPGLNVIQAPNEWGKSTWCAFLTIMLYGLDTRAKTTKTVLAEKERYAPWSGAPMSGRLEISWQGRDITIERRAKGRTPMGDFSAYETESGLPVPELTASTCGQALLGVERSVFQRSGFIQLSDLPVTQDEALRRRLNALVTTGDESGAGDDLAQKLKDLKNKCRFNRSGLLPQAEAQRDEVESKLRELAYLQDQVQQMEAQQLELEAYTLRLENHKQALAYQAAQADIARVAQAQADCRQAAAQLEAAGKACESLPAQALAQEKLDCLNALAQEQAALLSQPLPQEPQKPQVPMRYLHIPPEEAVAEAQHDLDYLKNLERVKKVNAQYLWIYAAVAAALLLSLLIPAVQPFGLYIGLAVALGGVAVLALCAHRTNKMRSSIQQFYDLHPGLSPDKWLQEAQNYASSYALYTQALEAVEKARASWNQRKNALDARLVRETEGQPLSQAIAWYQKALAHWNILQDAQREHDRCKAHAEALGEMVKPVQAPTAPDALTFTPQQTAHLLEDTAFTLKQLHTRRGQALGKMEALGSESALQSQWEALNTRIQGLNQTYKALELALSTLSEASAQLQRRFAPRISQQAQEIFSRLTGGRYRRLTLSEDLSVSTSADTETTLRPALWRSEGTIDQLYLSLRLAVARELTPHAPLVLDDALARFDDIRLEQAMAVLKEEAENRQVLLFTCQKREHL